MNLRAILMAAVLLLIAFLIGMGVWGLVLAFKASLILGLVVLLIEPVPFFLGLIALFGHPEVSRQIVEYAERLIK